MQFGEELPFCFKPVPDIVTVIAATSDIDFKSAVSNLYVSQLLRGQSRLRQLRLLQNNAMLHQQFRTASASGVSFFVMQTAIAVALHAGILIVSM